MRTILIYFCSKVNIQICIEKVLKICVYNKVIKYVITLWALPTFIHIPTAPGADVRIVISRLEFEY